MSNSYCASGCVHTHAVLCFLCSLIHCLVYLGCSFLLPRNWHGDTMIMVRLNLSIDAQPDRLVRNVCLKLSQYGRTFKCLKNLLYPLILFKHFNALKAGEKQNRRRIFRKIPQIVHPLSVFSWLDDQPLHILEKTEDTHLSGWRQPDIFFLDL